MKYYYLLKKRIKEIAAYRINIYSANTSFYIVLSIFPGIMLLMALIPYFGFRAEDLMESMDGLIPEILAPIMERIFYDLQGNSTGVLLSATAIVAVWSSSRGVYCIQQGLNAIYGIRENRPYFISRLISMVYMLFLIFALILTLIVNGFGREIAAIFSRQPIPLLNIIAKVLQFRGFILFLLLTILFTAMYCVFPNRKQSVRFALPGAALAAMSWLIFTAAYSYYAKHFGAYSVLYGSLSVIAMGMFWLYICISILFYGCVLNLYIERRK